VAAKAAVLLVLIHRRTTGRTLPAAGLVAEQHGFTQGHRVAAPQAQPGKDMLEGQLDLLMLQIIPVPAAVEPPV
jgi:hypothetical protein